MQSFPVIKKVVKPVKIHSIEIEEAPISVSAFLDESLTERILETKSILNYDLVLLPGFVQWDSTSLEEKFSVRIRKGPEFASELPALLKNIENVDLSNVIPANKIIEFSGEDLYSQIVKERYDTAKKDLGLHTFYINDEKSELIIGRDLPPPIIAEIVNCTDKSDKSIIKKAKHYIDSGADIIDIGCVSNKPNPLRVKEIIQILRSNFNILLSIDSMNPSEILAAVDMNIDMILSFDIGNYKEFINIPKDIPIVILPTNIREGIFPRNPEIRVEKLIALTKILKNHGFTKLIADPLLETPISPGICNSLETYFLYKKLPPEDQLPLFFGISNVVELMDIDSIGINGLLASIAVELDMGILFTVEHSPKLFGGVRELKDSMRLNYLAKNKNTPPINQGLSLFKAKGKISQKIPQINEINAISVDLINQDYIPDNKGYFRIYMNQLERKIYVLFYSIQDNLLHIFTGDNAEALSKEIIKQNITNDYYHLNYLGRELNKAEMSLFLGKPYIQDD
ncbi:MAG: dihydropteroate synthase-like protein [Promethearchaeota archaeon]|jgi:dihydropteroate synthase-like protein